ncbi:N-lysine methyltransferase SMYD2-A isoform X1 [Canna indica]|uniref:N-lysine methyltransferase SMYD2-A isoform X1 n=1 Tax=Canna indica TaxID=4628 RepID=A0AAQ3KFR8_9LILI|nr:N-lysine methyltransferase SMYD2-A isoform X1 [Canna indica]
MHKLGLLQECMRDCNRAIATFPTYAKAWYRRGKANASLKKYKDAKLDLEVALSMEDSLSRKSQIKGELTIVLCESNHTNVTGMVNDNGAKGEVDSLAQSQAIALHCVSTQSKGRGLTSGNDIPPTSLVHYEQPLGAILLKACRDTHCHFCFVEVPADAFFCPSCIIPVYCSNSCQEKALGEQSIRNHDNCLMSKNLSADLQKHVMHVLLANHVRSPRSEISTKHIPEHRHECGGVHWSSVLPPDIVLAARVMVASIERWKAFGRTSSPLDYLDLSSNYSQNSPVYKLESHIYAVVLLHCLHKYYNSDFPFSGVSAGQLILVISQVKVNSMAIVHMKSIYQDEALRNCSKLSTSENYNTQSTEQVKVAQAIYLKGSLFNHSCQPNVHAYFISRTLFVRTTELVSACCPLELSYGPQVGQLDRQDRQKLLEEQYLFQCNCSGCSELNLSDIVINAFRCDQPYCLGAVLEAPLYKRLDDNFLQVSDASSICKISLPLPNHEKEKDISNVAQLLLNERGAKSHVSAGQCLSCGCYCNLKYLAAASKSSVTNIQRLKDSLGSDEIPDAFLSDILNSLSHLRSVRHPYSKIVAEAEDNVAEAFVRIGKFELGMQHCIASIKILEKLYHRNHIVMGHELMKLASIQLCLGDYNAALVSIERAESIFSLHYESHVDQIFPHLKILRSQAENSAA